MDQLTDQLKVLQSLRNTTCVQFGEGSTTCKNIDVQLKELIAKMSGAGVAQPTIPRLEQVPSSCIGLDRRDAATCARYVLMGSCTAIIGGTTPAYVLRECPCSCAAAAAKSVAAATTGRPRDVDTEIVRHEIAPFVQNGAKHRDLRCVLRPTHQRCLATDDRVLGAKHVSCPA